MFHVQNRDAAHLGTPSCFLRVMSLFPGVCVQITGLKASIAAPDGSVVGTHDLLSRSKRLHLSHTERLTLEVSTMVDGQPLVLQQVMMALRHIGTGKTAYFAANMNREGEAHLVASSARIAKQLGTLPGPFKIQVIARLRTHSLT